MDSPVVVIDCGSSTTRVRLAIESTPRAEFPTVVGRNIRKDGASADDSVFVGPEAVSRGRAQLTIKYPVEHGMVTNWDDMERLWNYTFHDLLNAPPSEHAVLLTEPPCNSKAYREKATQIMFETFECKAVYLANRSVLSLLSTGKTSGLVLSVGHQSALSVPVYEGCSLPHAVTKLFVSGSDLTYYLVKLVQDSGCKQEITRAFIDSLDIAKQKLCYVSLNYEAAMASQNNWIESKHTLPDGTVITVGSERFQCPEALFRPSLLGMESPGLHEIAHYNFHRYDKDIHDLLYSNIVLAGKTMLLPGLVVRVQSELSKLAPHAKTINATQAAPNSAWNGGSLLGSTSDFHASCITATEYDEFGPSLVHKKCFS